MSFHLNEASLKLAVVLAHPCSTVTRSGQIRCYKADEAAWVYAG